MSLASFRSDLLRQNTTHKISISFLTRPWSVLPKAILLDLVERTILITIFIFFAVRMLPSFQLTSDLAIPLMLLSEVLPVFLILFRKWGSTISDRPLDWALGFIGANTTMLLVAPEVSGTIIPPELCSLVILTGLLIQISAKLILWRSFGLVAANRGVKVAGPYRFVRHPMYAGYTIGHIGFLLAFPSMWNAVIYSAALVVQVARLLKEEELLNNDLSYREFSARVRFRLCPGVF